MAAAMATKEQAGMIGAATGRKTTAPPSLPAVAFADRIRRRLGLAWIVQGRRAPDQQVFDTHGRIRRELFQFWAESPPFCRPGSSPVTDPFHFKVVIDGPDGSPYAGGTFLLDVALPSTYPFSPPELTFKTKVYHPNIHVNTSAISLDIFDKAWSPALTIRTLLLSIVSVLSDPMLDHPVNAAIAEKCKNRPEVYEANARACTRSHASAPIASYYPMKEDYFALDLAAVTAASSAASQGHGNTGWWPSVLCGSGGR